MRIYLHNRICNAYLRLLRARCFCSSYSKEDYDLVKQQLEDTKGELEDLKQKFSEIKRKSIFDHFVKVLSDTVSCK